MLWDDAHKKVAFSKAKIAMFSANFANKMQF